MASFSEEEFDYRRIDVWAIVAYGGLATVAQHRRGNYLAWLRRHGYEVTSLDCTLGIIETVKSIERLLRWKEQFGYTLESRRLNLDALRDGFEFDVPEQGGVVLELVRPDIAWQDDPRWVIGLLSIAQEHCRFHLAFGRRFFTLLVLNEQSPLVGQVVEQSLVPSLFSGMSDTDDILRR